MTEQEVIEKIRTLSIDEFFSFCYEGIDYKPGKGVNGYAVEFSKNGQWFQNPCNQTLNEIESIIIKIFAKKY